LQCMISCKFTLWQSYKRYSFIHERLLKICHWRWQVVSITFIHWYIWFL
jgi:hypothetical protein